MPHILYHLCSRLCCFISLNNFIARLSPPLLCTGQTAQHHSAGWRGSSLQGPHEGSQTGQQRGTPRVHRGTKPEASTFTASDPPGRLKPFTKLRHILPLAAMAKRCKNRRAAGCSDQGQDESMEERRNLHSHGHAPPRRPRWVVFLWVDEQFELGWRPAFVFDSKDARSGQGRPGHS